jgi:nucleoside-diphosphate-sugar epimerase
MKTRTRTLLVCGVMGHIGFEIARVAAEKKYKVIGVYNKSQNQKKIKILKKLKVKLIKNNLQNIYTLKKIIKVNNLESCVYASAVSHEIYAKKNPNKTLDVNCRGVQNLLSVINKKFKFIYLSTGSVYQDIKNQKKINEDKIPTPTSLYSGTKRLGEIIVDFYHQNFNKNCTSLRVSWVYGPPIICRKINIQRGPIPFLVYKFSKNKTIFNLKSGKAFKASFTYIDDVTYTILSLLDIKKFKSSSYNLGTGKNNNIAEIFKILNKVKKIKFKIGKGVSPWSNSSVVRGPLNSKYKNIKANINLKNGLIKYLEWLKINA